MILKQTGKFYALLLLAIGSLNLFGQPTSPAPATNPPLPAVTQITNVPLRTIASLIRDRNAAGFQSNEVIHVRGAVLDQRLGEYLAIRDETGTILVQSIVVLPVKMQTVVDAWGLDSGNPNHLFLDSAR